MQGYTVILILFPFKIGARVKFTRRDNRKRSTLRLSRAESEWLPSRRMPTFKHFLRRQYWHWFRWCWSIGHELNQRSSYGARERPLTDCRGMCSSDCAAPIAWRNSCTLRTWIVRSACRMTYRHKPKCTGLELLEARNSRESFDFDRLWIRRTTYDFTDLFDALCINCKY